MTETKQCTKCKQVKPLTEFGKNKQTRDGLTCWCKACKNEYARQRRKTPEGIYDAMKARQTFYHNHRPSFAKPFTITREEFVEWYNKQEKKCAYCDLPEERLGDVVDSNINKTARLTIDCADNDKGYAKGNVVLSCLRCNFTKMDFFSYKVFRDLAQHYIKPVWEEQLGCKL